MSALVLRPVPRLREFLAATRTPARAAPQLAAAVVVGVVALTVLGLIAVPGPTARAGLLGAGSLGLAETHPGNGTGNGSGNGSGGPTAGWIPMAPPRSPPGTAAGAAFAYDPVDGYDVLFGGCTDGSFWYSACTPSNATWTYHNGTWIQLSPASSPPARFYSSMVWTDGQILLFGGNTTTSFLNDTWVYSHGNWTEVFPATSPGARAGAGLAYDGATGQAILFGGEANRSLTDLSTETYTGWDYNDTWAYAGGQWSQLHPANSPGARDAPSMAYDPVTARVVLFGGFNWSIYNTADTWTFAQGDWTYSTTASGPMARNNGALAYDASLGGLVLFGGHTGWDFLNDTWLYANANWTYLGSTPGLSARWGASLAPDGNGCLILFGGYEVTGYNALQGTYLNDTWGLGACTETNSSGNGTGVSSGGGTGNATGSGNSTGSGNATGNVTGGTGGNSTNGSAPAPGTGPSGGSAASPNPAAQPPSSSSAPSASLPGAPLSVWAGLFLVAGMGLGFIATRRERAPPSAP